MSIPANLSPTAFRGTAEYYARYRPPYPCGLLDHLMALVQHKERLLDLACGPGRVALALAPAFQEVWAIDLEPEMIAVGKTEAASIANIVWKTGRAEDLEAPPGHFDLIAVGEAFHRLDQQHVLASALHWLKPGGIFATMGGTGPLQGTQPWQHAVTDLVKRATRDVFPEGWASAKPGAATRPEEVEHRLRDAGFVAVATRTFTQPHDWTIDTIAGYLQSTSVCSPGILGDRRDAFLAELGATLRAHSVSGPFREQMEFGCTAARKPGGRFTSPVAT